MKTSTSDLQDSSDDPTHAGPVKLPFIRHAIMLAGALGMAATAHADLVYHWNFRKSVVDSRSGVTADIVNPSGRSTEGYFFGGGAGITVQQPADKAVTGVYAIELVFSLTQNDEGYQRIVDFQNLTTDEGMYAYDDYFYFYDESPDLANYTFLPNQEIKLVLMRNADGIFTAILNGNTLWNFDDSTTQFAVFSGPGHVMHFFIDDGSEHPTGLVKSIRVFNKASLRDDTAISAKRLEIKKLNKKIKKAKKKKQGKKVKLLKKKLKKKKAQLEKLLDY